MFDLIDILGAILSLMLMILAVLALSIRRYLTSISFLVLSVLPLLWAGYFRLPIPQTLVWMGMNICAIVFVWQGGVGLLSKSSSSNLLEMPLQFSKRSQILLSLVIGFLFAALIILTQI